MTKSEWHVHRSQSQNPSSAKFVFRENGNIKPMGFLTLKRPTSETEVYIKLGLVTSSLDSQAVPIMISVKKFLSKQHKPSHNVLPFLKVCCIYFSFDCFNFVLTSPLLFY